MPCKSSRTLALRIQKECKDMSSRMPTDKPTMRSSTMDKLKKPGRDVTKTEMVSFAEKSSENATSHTDTGEQ
jgi:hypothetical protein